MRLRTHVWAAVMCLASVIGAKSAWAQDTSKPAKTEEEKHTAIYCSVFTTQCKQEAALKKYADSLQRKVTSYENGTACSLACKTAVDSLNKKIAALQLAQKNMVQAPARHVSSASQTTPKPVGTRSAVTRTAQSTKRVPVTKEIARIDSVPYPVFVHDTVIDWHTKYDTVYVSRAVRDTITMSSRGGLPWKWLALGGIGCLAEGAIVNRDIRKPYCINIRVKSKSISH